MHLEIGGGTLASPDAYNLDANPAHATPGWNRFAQQAPWPCDDGTFDTIKASHVMEHIPAGVDRITVMNEAYRALKPGGQFTIIVPGIVARNAGEFLGWWAIADPTHVSFWLPESFHYFDGTFAANADYGIRIWNTVSLDIKDGWEITWIGTHD